MGGGGKRDMRESERKNTFILIYAFVCEREMIHK